MKIVILTGSETRHVYFRKKMASDTRIEVLTSYCENDEKSLANRNKQNEQTSQLEIQHVEARTQSEIDFFSDYIESSEDKSNPKLISKGAINDEAIVNEIVAMEPDLLVCYGSSLIKSDLLTKFEGKSVFYSVTDKTLFKNKKISIFGGGDSALDWALEFSKYSKVTLIHRRNEFRGAPHTLKELEKLKAAGKITIKTPFQIDSINDGKEIKFIKIKNDDEKIENIETDFILGFFGLIMQLGPIAEWGLNMDKKNY